MITAVDTAYVTLEANRTLLRPYKNASIWNRPCGSARRSPLHTSTAGSSLLDVWHAPVDEMGNKMRRWWRLSRGIWIAAWTVGSIWAQQKTLTWEAAKAEFLAINPTMQAGQLGVQESRAEEITAFLRPNPDLTVAVDQINLFTGHPYRPFGQALTFVASSYLVERRHKRELRLESAKEGTAIAVSQLADQERNLLFNVRTAFVQVLQQKAALAVTAGEPRLL